MTSTHGCESSFDTHVLGSPCPPPPPLCLRSRSVGRPVGRSSIPETKLAATFGRNSTSGPMRFVHSRADPLAGRHPCARACPAHTCVASHMALAYMTGSAWRVSRAQAGARAGGSTTCETDQHGCPAITWDRLACTACVRARARVRARVRVCVRACACVHVCVCVSVRVCVPRAYLTNTAVPMGCVRTALATHRM